MATTTAASVTSLTRVATQLRANRVTVRESGIAPDFPTGGRHFGSVTNVRFTTSGPRSFFDVSPDHLQPVAPNGTELDLGRSSNRRPDG